MKKVVLVLAVLMLAAPALAEVVITATDDGGGKVIVSYTSSDEPNVVALGLDIQLDNDANITEVLEVNENFWVYPGSIDVNADGSVDSNGTADCNKYQYAPGTPAYAGTLPGIDTNGVSVEMAALYVGAANAPPKSGKLFAFKVDGDTCATITANVIRGSIVLENATTADSNFTAATNVCVSTGCPCWFDVTGATYLVPDNNVDSADYGILLGDLNYAKWLVGEYNISEANATTAFLWRDCFDITGPSYLVPDKCINSLDYGILLGDLNYAQWLYTEYKYICHDSIIRP